MSDSQTLLPTAPRRAQYAARRAIPQVVRMKISGHETDSLGRRRNMVDSDDLSVAKELLEKRMKAPKALIHWVPAT